MSSKMLMYFFLQSKKMKVIDEEKIKWICFMPVLMRVRDVM